MTLNLGGWIHSFTVTETLTHKKGYTIYKVTSIVFPRSVPQALTCITVWKRFHDIKRLHRELVRRQKTLKLTGQIPEPTDCSFFKRFDTEIINKRKEYILQLLDFAAQHPALYKCHAFIQFFSDGGHSPGESPLHRILPNMLETGNRDGNNLTAKSAIAEICDNIDLRYDHDNISLLDPERDDNENKGDGGSDQTLTNTTIATLTHGGNLKSEQNANYADAKPQICKDYTRFLTPMASIESEDSDYIYEAALEFSHAVQAEANLEYKEAHDKYKKGVEVLLNGSKDDANDERKFIAKAKISKYLNRADDIYDKFLSEQLNNANKTNFQLSIDVIDNPAQGALYLEHPWNHLTKYKVLQVLGDSVMQVQSITEPNRPIYIMKGIEKPSSNSPTQTVFLPQCVPYMVNLIAFFQSEQKIFLLLKQAEGGRLYDYVLSYKPKTTKATNLNQIFPDVDEVAGEASAVSAQDSGCADCGSIAAVEASTVSPPLMDNPTDATEFLELVRCSQQLLESVSNTISESKTVKEIPHELPNLDKTLDPMESDALEQRIHHKLPEACLKQWARELAVAIHSLHAKGIILGDLHMENLLLGSKGQLMLTYCYQNEGLTCDNYVHKAFNLLALSGHYVAPERPLTTKSDWWSYGVILYQLLLGLSFKESHPGHIDLYGCVQYPENAEISDCARDLLDSLLQAAPEDRLDYEQLQRHTFFEGTDWNDVLRKSFETEI